MRSVRVWFTKTGSAKYISHLDINRCMLRVLNRARLPVWYTEGFNPHPYVTFALPLSLGIESEGEPMDIRIIGDLTHEAIKDCLAGVMPDGIDITAVTDAVDNAKTIRYAEYEIDVEFATAKEAIDFCDKAIALVQEGDLKAERMGKRGRYKVMKEVILKDLISKFTAEGSQNRVIIDTVLAAGSNANLNPNLLVDTILKETGADAAVVKIVRKKLLKADFDLFK